MKKYFSFAVLLITLLGIVGISTVSMGAKEAPANNSSSSNLKSIILAGGCFWCVEADFDKLEGVVETISGYSGGHVDNPTYKQVTKGGTGHYEVVKVTYDPSKTTLETLISYYWRHVDPTDSGGQFCDRGPSYRTAVFVANADERAIVEASKIAIEEAGLLDNPIVTPILDTNTFWPAERYHQNYYKKNPVRYRYYRTACGRNKRINHVWRNEASRSDS